MLSLALISVTMKKQSGTFSCKTNAWVSNNSSTSTWDRTWRNNQYFSGTNTQTGSFNIKSVIYTSEPLQRHSEAKSTKYLAKLSSTPLVSNPSILTTPPKRRIHFVNYLDDNDSQKQWKQTQRQRCRAQSTLTSPEIRNVPLHVTTFLSSVPVFSVLQTKREVAWVGSVQPECTIPLGTGIFRNFKPDFSLIRKRQWLNHKQSRLPD